MATATRTVNPLHFEDLEPHRFEDLVRQLAYNYRNWKSLEATGRLGDDGGLDIRGVEMSSVASRVYEDDEEAEYESPLPSDPSEEREWRIQCKRYKQIGPTLIRAIVRETLAEVPEAPHGLVVAAACDVSAKTMAAFRQEAIGQGVIEFRLWTKAHLEDMLFRPENNHLLFAYFGISLGVRRRSEIQRIRGTIAIKRKLMRALKADSVQSSIYDDLLIRDVFDEQYPDEDRVHDFWRLPYPPWEGVRAEFFHANGIFVCRRRFDGWVKRDGTWDLLDESKEPGSPLAVQRLL